MPRKDPEGRKEYNKKYREVHHEELKVIKNLKHDCECGGQYTEKMKARHNITNLHQEWLKK